MMEKRKHRGMLILLLGGVLMLLGACLLAGMDNLMQYVMPAPASTQEGGELEALYEEGQKQLEAMADALFSGAIGARKQSVSLAAENGQSVQAALYAVGVGYFDVLHETLQNGRLISEMDIEKAQDVIVLDESAALTLFAGDDPVGGRVTLEGQEYEVAGVIRGGRRIGELDEHIAYIPITAASRHALAMQTVEVTAHGTDLVASAIQMEDTLSSWRPGGSFYSFGKRALGAVMPLRWVLLIGGGLVLLSLLARLNAFTWGRVCLYADRLKTRYARDMLGGMAASLAVCLLGYALLAGATFLLARFSIQPLYVFTEWVPEVVVELSSLNDRFWSLNNLNASAVRCVSRFSVRQELGQGLFRWGMMAALLGAALYGIPWLNRRVRMPKMNREH